MGIEDIEGIETFFDNYKPGKDTKELILGIGMYEHPKPPPLAILARLYRQSGHQRLIELSSKMGEAIGNVMPEHSVLKEHLSPVEIKSLHSNSAFVVFGCVIPILEQAVCGYYDMKNFWWLYEDSTSYSVLPLPKRIEESSDVSTLNPIQWKALNETIKSDLTLGSFLETSSIRNLPEDLAEILKYVQGNLPNLYDFINNHRYLARAIIN